MIISRLCVLLLLTAVAWSKYVVKELCGQTEYCIEVGGLSYRPLLESQDRVQLVKNVNEWVKKMKLSVANIVIRDTPKMGLGVFTLENLEPQAPLLIIPEYLSLSESSISVEAFNDVDDKQLEHFYDYPKLADIENEDQVAFALLYHMSHIESSIFKDYLFLISPDDTMGFLRFTDEELTVLRDDVELLDFIEENRHSLFTRYQKVREIYESTFTVEQRVSLLGNPTISMADYVWAWSYVRSHSWRGAKNKRTLIPIADYVNCEPRANVDPKGFVGKDMDGSSKIFADRRYKAGSEIFWNYGQISSRSFLFFYGFVPQINELDCIEIGYFSKECEFRTPIWLTTLTDFENIGAPHLDMEEIFKTSILQCLSPEGEQYFKLGVINSVYNMNEEEKIECAKLIAQKNEDATHFDTFLELCPEKKWEKSFIPNITSFLVDQIKTFSTVARVSIFLIWLLTVVPNRKSMIIAQKLPPSDLASSICSSHTSNLSHML